jgi:rRNA processing protein Gar1
MENLNYSSDNDKNDEYILEDEDEVGYDSANDDNDSGTAEVNDLDFIASYAVDVPLFEVSHHSSQKATDVATNDVQSTAVESDNDSDDDEIENDMEIEDDVDSSSSSDSDSEDEALTAGQRKSRFGGKLTSMLTEEEDEDQAVGPPRTKNEILETVLYPDNGVKVTAQDVLVNIGEVMYRIDHECVVVVQAKHTTHPLNEGSVLCSDKGVVLGRIHEVFGPITTPFYVVRWNGKPPQTAQSAGGKQTGGGGGKGKNNNRGNNRNKNKEDITDAVPADAPLDGPSCSAMSEAAQDASMSEAIADSIKSAPVVEVRSVQQVNELFVPGTAVFMVQSHSSFVTPGVLIQQHGKGSDASNAHDEEVGD